MSYNSFLEDIKKVAVSAVKASNPFAFVLGKVTSASPLKIYVDQKFEITSAQLILTNAVRDHNVEMEVDHQTETAEGHVHAYKGTKTFKVKNKLKVGEQVLLLRADGGQKFIVLDRVKPL